VVLVRATGFTFAKHILVDENGRNPSFHVGEFGRQHGLQGMAEQ